VTIFDFSWRDHCDRFASEGWVHVTGGVAPAFLDTVRCFIDRAIGSPSLSGPLIRGPKDQLLFEFPESIDLGGDLFDVVAPLTGLRRATMTLAERHIKMYAHDADPEPMPHKDRLSSQIALGISVEVPAGSHVVLYPHDERDVNPYYVSTGLRESLEPEALPEVTLRDAAKVEVHDAPGDVIVFRGSSIWHLRRRSAGTVILYLKMNDFDSDPLGEDPSTATRREETARALCANGEYFAASVVVLARRFDSVQHNHGRGGLELRAAVVAGEPPVPLSDAEAAVLRAVDGHTPCAVLTTRTEGFDAGAAQQAIRRLAARGVLDLLSPPPRGAAR
jgi:hypothetical protein